MTAQTDSRRIYMQSFLLVGAIMLLILGTVYVKGIVLNQHGELVDTDSFMHMVKVVQLAEGGEWYDAAIHGSNYPYGDELHWTRLFDIVLLVGAYALKPFIGFKKGLLIWGIIISPVLGLLSLIGITWASRPILNNDAQRWLWLIFMSQTVLLQVFYFGRPDHHSLLLLLFILLVGCLLRIGQQTNPTKYALLSGLTAAFAMWASVESILFVLIALVTIWFYWLTKGGVYGRQLLLFSLSVFICSVVFLFIERSPSEIMNVEYDKISIVYVFVFTVAVVASYIMFLLNNVKIGAKLLTTSLICGAGIFSIWFLFPDFFKGPMAGLNPALVPIWYSRVVEAQPVWKLDIQMQTTIFGSVVFFLVYLIYLIGRKRNETNFHDIAPLIIGFAVLLPAGVAQLRTCYFLMIVIIIVLAMFADTIMKRISDINLSSYLKPMVRVAVLLLFMLGLPGIGMMTASASDSSGNTGSRQISQPDLAEMSVFLNTFKIMYPQAKTILTSIDFGPEILYRTGLNIIAGPYHRNDEGILYVHNVMASEEMVSVKRMLDERSIDLLLLCPGSSETLLYAATADKASFYERLIAGEVPDFLEKVSLPPDLSRSFILFKVRR